MSIFSYDLSSIYLFVNDGKFFIPEFFFLAMLFLVFIFGTFFTYSKYYRYPLLQSSMGYLVSYGFIGTMYLFLSQSYVNSFFFNNMFIFSETILKIKILLVGFGLIILLGSILYLSRFGIYVFEYFVLFGFSIFSMCLLVSSNDLLSFYLCIELQSFCFYLLATLHRTNNFSTEAGLKYFLLGAISSGILLFGISIIYGMFGTTNFEDCLYLNLGMIWEFNNVYFVGGLVGMVFILCGILFKLGAAPFHFWSPDVYQGAPTVVTLVFSTIPKIAMFFMCWRIFVEIFEFYNYYWESLVLVSIFLSNLIGSFGALVQKNIKRFLAFSSINHVGFLLLGIFLHSVESLQSMWFYLFYYLIMVIGTFLFFMHTVNKQIPVKFSMTEMYVKQFTFLSDLQGLATISSVQAFVFFSILFSFAGIPPLAGFFSKFFLLWSVVGKNNYILVFILLSSTLLSTFYYIRLLKTMYFYNIKQRWPVLVQVDYLNSWLLVIILFTVYFFFWSPNLFLFTAYLFVVLLG